MTIKIKTVIIITILLLFIGSILFVNLDFSSNNISKSTTKVEKIPECRDGFDNDGDGDKDFPFDSDCSSETDTNEGSNAFWWLLLLIGIIAGGVYLYKNKKKTDEENLLQKPIDMDIANKNLISWFLKKYGEDIPKYFEQDSENNSIIYYTQDKRHIEEIWRERDDSKETGNIEYYCGIQVNIGRFHGFHVLSTSLSKGIEYIINGNITFRKSNWVASYGEWKKMKRTFNPSSLQSSQDRLTLLALESGDEDDLKYIQDKFKSGVVPNKSNNTDDLDDFELAEFRKNMQNSDDPNKKKKKANQGYKQKVNQAINELGDEE